MTDTYDLRRMLDELADETPELPAGEWIAETRHKARVRRRARWAGGGAAVALVLAAAATVVPQVVNSAEPDPVAPAEGDGVFPEQLRGGELVAARTNQPGESAVEWEVTLDEPTPFMLFCQAPERLQSWDRQRSALRVVLEINGRPARVEACAHPGWYGYPPVDERMVRGPLAGMTSAPQSLARSVVRHAGDWEGRYDWKPGDSLEVSVWLERNGDSVEIPAAEFGVAFYDGMDLGPRPTPGPGEVGGDVGGGEPGAPGSGPGTGLAPRT